MAASTAYDITLRYLLEDRATKGAKKVEQSLDRTNKSAGRLSGTFARLVGAAGAFFGLRAAGSALIGYNKQLEDARTNIAGLVMATTGAEWGTSIGAATAMMTELQGRSAKSTATTMEMVDFLNKTVQPLVAAGMEASKLAEFTADAVIAAKALNFEHIASYDIMQALTKGVTIRDLFAMNLLRNAKLTNEEFNKMDKGQRLAVLMKQVSSPAMKKLGQEQASTFSGVWSTFVDNMQRTMGTVGKGLFEGIRRQLMELNVWLSNNQATVKDVARTVGQHLVTGFNVIKSVISFFVDHADTLILVAKTWAGLKLGGMAASLMGGVAGGGGFLQRMGGGLLAKNFDRTGLRVASFGATLNTAAGFVSRFLGPLGLAAGALKGIYDWWNKEDPSKKKKRLEAGAAAAGLVQTRAAMRPILEEELRLRGARALTKGGNVGTFEAVTGQDIGSRYAHKTMKGVAAPTPAEQLQMKQNAAKLKQLHATMSDGQRALAEWAIEQKLAKDDLSGFRTDSLGDMNALAKEHGLGIEEWQNVMAGLELMNAQIRSGELDLANLLAPDATSGAYAAVPQVAPTEDAKPGKVNVTIQRIEVRSDDPDRFAFNLQSSLSKVASSPGQSGLAQRIAGG